MFTLLKLENPLNNLGLSFKTEKEDIDELKKFIFKKEGVIINGERFVYKSDWVFIEQVFLKSEENFITMFDDNQMELHNMIKLKPEEYYEEDDNQMDLHNMIKLEPEEYYEEDDYDHYDNYRSWVRLNATTNSKE
jgi:Tfp pilus assembly ATPase PilU